MNSSVFQDVYNFALFYVSKHNLSLLWCVSEHYINGITLYEAFRDWLLSFKIIFEIHLLWCAEFVYLHHIWRDNNLSILIPIGINPSFQFFAFTTNVMGNIPICTCCTYTNQGLQGFCLEVEQLDCRGYIFSVFLETTKLIF